MRGSPTTSFPCFAFSELWLTTRCALFRPLTPNSMQRCCSHPAQSGFSLTEHRELVDGAAHIQGVHRPISVLAQAVQHCENNEVRGCSTVRLNSNFSCRASQTLRVQGRCCPPRPSRVRHDPPWLARWHTRFVAPRPARQRLSHAIARKAHEME